MERLCHLPNLPIREALLSVAVLACGTPQNREFLQGDRFIIDGSSTVSLISQVLAEESNKAEAKAGGRGGMVVVGTSGTGGGFQKFCHPGEDRDVALIGASRPITEEEKRACEERGVDYQEIPIAIDGIVVVVNKNNTWVKGLTFKELKRIWEPAAQGKITRWSQIRDDWPDTPLSLYGPGTASGTFDYFTGRVIGIAKMSRGDYNASEIDGTLVIGVKGDINGLAYFGYPYGVNNIDKLKIVPLDGGNGLVIPDESTIRNGQYPLSRPLFFYVNTERLRENPAVGRLLTYFFKNTEKIVIEAGYIPLQRESYRQSFEAIQKQGRMPGGIPSS